MSEKIVAGEEVHPLISELCQSIQQSEVSRTADDILEKVYENQLYNGRSTEVLIAGVVFAACRSENVPVTAVEISEELGVEKDSVINTYKYLSNRIDGLSSLPVEWELFLESFCDNLDVKDSIRELAFDIGETGAGNGLLSGRSPRGYAAGCLYAATRHVEFASGITQELLANESGVSKSTIRSTYQKLLRDYENER